mmetsp:Transcript_38159/g.109503  ORF Transcript_38159/g.109503 Transcript_38159/m.109503 type:complete len:272 (-) Transcript_38159:66-881(-)
MLHLLLLLRVQRQVALRLLDSAHHLFLRRGVEHVARPPQLLGQMLRDVSARDVRAHHRVREREALVDGHRVRDAIAAIEDDPCGAATGVERQDGLRGHEERRRPEGLEEDLGRLLAVLARVQWRLGQQHGMLLGNNFHLGIDVPPDELHVIPVLDYTVGHGVLEGQDAAKFLGLGADEVVALRRAGHDAGVFGSADIRWEGALDGLFARKAGLHNTAAIVDHHRLVRNHLGEVCVLHLALVQVVKLGNDLGRAEGEQDHLLADDVPLKKTH